MDSQWPGFGHYYLSPGDNVAQIQINFAGKKNRSMQSHAMGLRICDDLMVIAASHEAKPKLVETPLGRRLLHRSLVRSTASPTVDIRTCFDGAQIVRHRLALEPGVRSIWMMSWKAATAEK